jgi:type VI secretion system protein ImpK
MNIADIRDLSFAAEFQDFYSEVIRLRRLAESGVALTAPGSDTASSAASSADVQAQVISARLSGMMERQSLFAGRSVGEIGFGLYREVQYVMAALADETFLRLDWPGRRYWTTHLLETQLFDSHTAGEEFFARMDRLLEQHERSYTDIYAVYLMALSLGFRGKYWGVDDGGRIANYRQSLFLRVYRRRPELFVGQAQLFPEAYRHTLSDGVARRLPSPHRWFAALAVAVLLWLGVAWELWHSLTDDLQVKAAGIVESEKKIENKVPKAKAPGAKPPGAKP